MRELERMIEIYHTGFIVCLILACVFFAAAAIMFFKFDIRRIIDMKTGRGARKSIQKMEEINAKTGKLRQDMVSHTPAMLRPEDRIAYPRTASNLQEQTDTAVPETSILSQDSETADKRKESSLPGYFVIKKEMMWVHTEEVL